MGGDGSTEVFGEGGKWKAGIADEAREISRERLWPGEGAA